MYPTISARGAAGMVRVGLGVTFFHGGKTVTFDRECEEEVEGASTGAEVKPELPYENKVLSCRFCSLQDCCEEAGIWG